MDLHKIVRPFFAEHCTGCHGEKKTKGDLRLDTLGIDYTSPNVMAHWEEIMNRINSGEMPPEEERRPNPETVAQVSEWIAAQLLEGEAKAHASGAESVSFRKLSRVEYGNTIQDLLGVRLDVADPTGLPEDPAWQGFERIGSVLTMSPTHVEKYLTSAEAALNEALALGPPPKREVIHWGPLEIRTKWRGVLKDYTARGILDRVRVDVVPNNSSDSNPGGNKFLEIKTTGEYLVRVKVSGLRPTGGIPPRLMLNVIDLDRVLIERDIETPEHQPVTLEFRAHLPAGSHPIRIINAVAGPNPVARHSRVHTKRAYTGLETRFPWQLKLTDDDYQPLVPILLLDSVEWDGPIVDTWPTAAHQRIFFGGEHATQDVAYARAIIERFAIRAFRRPAQPGEVDRLVTLFEVAQKDGDDFVHSVRAALLAVLCSKSFVYLIEGDIGAGAARLTEWELASRLSYFLWSTMPDARLLELAGQGKLHEPEILRAEVRRMLGDERSRQFAEAFPRQWLQLRGVGMFPPDRKLYPDYDDYLERSMVGETTAFFGEVLHRDLGLREFLDSNWTMLNRRLAEHYGIAGVEGEEMQRVALGPDHRRGGVLTQAAVLSLTSDGTRHRPVHRGKWILESIIGKPPPPPPANVPAIKTSAPTEAKASLRAKIEAHRDDPNCAACHRKLDPLGLAFDNYDAIGRWRIEEIVSDGAGANPPIDASGQLADGRKFADAAGLKKLLVADLDQFAGAFSEKLATYALRRGMTFADRAELKNITARARTDEYKLTTVIEALVTSELFQKR